MSRGPALPLGVVGAVLSIGLLLAVPGFPGPTSTGPPAVPAGAAEIHPAATGAVRDPAVAGDGVGRILVTNTDPVAAPNDGLRTELAGFKIAPFVGLSSLQVGVEEVLGSNLVVFGLFQNSALGAYPFFSVFNNSTGRTVYQANESLDIVTPGVPYDFTFQASGGTNWTMEVNGAPFGGSLATSTLDFGVPASTDPSGVAFSMIALSQFAIVPPSLPVYTAFAVHEGSEWYLPRGGNSTWRGAASVEWGVAGAAQDPSLWPGELDLGTRVPPVPNGTMLWTGGPRPASASLSSEPSSAFGGGTTLVATRFSGPSGPIADLPVELRDTDGGSFLAPELTTDGNGTASTAYVAPNVTANATDVLSVASNVLGVGASATTSVAVAPSIQVLLNAVGDPSVPPGTTGGVEIEASAATTGARAVGIQLAVVLQGGGVVQPSSGVTDRNGHLTVNVTAPEGPTQLVLTVVVSTPGYWGKARISIANVAPTPSLVAQLGGYVGWILLGVVIAVALLLFVRTRLPRSRMRPMELRRRLPPQPPPSAPGAPAPVAPSPPTKDIETPDPPR
ncbi:MAG TPA: hypothetical protein VMH90_04460 [Thermoplasmata archaeon]|nr:hypothetical protein [Thermoplasmata archaeon]